LRREKEEVLSALLGEKYSDSKFQMMLAVWPDDMSASVAWLPSGKREAALAALETAGTQFGQLPQNQRSDAFAYFECNLKALKNILTPEELEEYRLRESPAAYALRRDGVYADMTPEEFKALLQVRGNDPGGAPRTDAKVRKETEALAETLGSERAQELVAKIGSEYSYMRKAAEHYGLHPDAADAALQVELDAEKAYTQIIDDPALSKEEKNSRFNARQASARADFFKCLGTNGATMACNGGAAWLYFNMDSYLLGRRPLP